MPRTKCRFQEGLRADEIAAALREGRCHSCSITAAELTREGKLLEICGEEHFSDLPGLEEYSAPVALCPECHHQAHLGKEFGPQKGQQAVQGRCGQGKVSDAALADHPAGHQEHHEKGP